MGWGAVVGGVAGGALDLWSRDKANRDNKAAAAKQMEFQEQMSSSAHQREVADLRAAGLNPILSAGGGSSSPSGSSYSSGAIAEGAGATALSIARTKADIESIEQGISESESRKKLQDAEKLNAVQSARVHAAQAAVGEAEAWNAQNRLRYEMKHPDAIGGLDAVLRRLGVLSGSAFALSGTGRILKDMFMGDPRKGKKR